jgi:hypothetical protein
LHVELLVPEGNADDFEKKVRDFVDRGAFKRFVPTADLSLALALRTPNSFVYRPQPDTAEGDPQVLEKDPLRGQRVYRYVNLWKVLSLEGLDLAPIMTASGDDDLYIAIDSLVAFEKQEFVVRMKWPLDGANMKFDGKNFLRVARHFYTSKQMALYAYDLPVVRRLQEKTGIRNFGYFQTATGTLETITEFWQLPSDSTPVNAATLEQSAKIEGASDEQRAVLTQVQQIPQDERHELYRSYL